MKTAAVQAPAGFKNILFATDFSPAAANAIPFVKAIAGRYSLPVARGNPKKSGFLFRSLFQSLFQSLPGWRPDQPVSFAYRLQYVVTAVC
jgi:hypothetical protein